MRRASWVSFSFLLVFTLSGWGQALTGTILGTISDPTGAVLPGVEVTITNVDTNLTRSVLTNGSGSYSAPNLPVGTYQLEASLPGFSTELVTNIVLRIDDDRRVDVDLAVGQVGQTIEITAETELFQSDTSSVGTVVTASTILGLPLNGRRFESLVELLPGSVNAAEGSELDGRGGFNISGYDENFHSFFLDGFDNGDPGIRSFAFRPSVDLIQEFSVLQNSYKAEYGRNGGAVINVTTRAGTNTFHGSAWEFHRNDNLDARNVFATESEQPDLLRNQFGATFGGPIVRDQTFFFVAYEGLREKRGEARRAFVPTLLMRGGNFSELSTPIVDPLTGQQFSGNIIPEGRMNPVARAVIQDYPLPNIGGAGPGSPNRLEIANIIDDTDNVSARVDTGFFENTQMMARYSFSDSRILDPFRSTGAGEGITLKDFGQTSNIIRTNTGVSFTTVFEPTFLHEFRFGYNRYKQPNVPVRSLPTGQAPLAGFVQKYLNFRPDGFAEIGSGTQFERTVNVYNYIDQMSWSLGSHQLKFGVDIRRYLFNAFSAGPNEFDFNGAATGHSLADMFLGIPDTTWSTDGDPGANLRKTEAAAYIQDDWKVTPRLTLNIGIRYEWYGRVTEKNNKQSNWDPETNSLVLAGQEVLPQLVDDDYNNFAPRVGLSFRPLSDDRTVVRAGYGIYYDNQMRHNFLQVGYPFVFRSTYLQTANFDLTLDDPFPAGEGGVSVFPFALEKEYRDSYAQHWNLGVQREILPDTVLDVSYVGNHFVKLARYRNPNQPIANTLPPLFPLSSSGIPGDPGPFPLIIRQEQAGSSIYHALQVRAEGRPVEQLSLISSYTWGHAIDDRPAQAAASMIAGIPFPQNSHAPGLDRASADFDIRHRYSLSYIYKLPGYDGGGPVRHLLDGWGMTGILTLQSGRPFTVFLENFPFGMRPNVVEGVDPVPANQGPDNWINIDAFSRPANPLGHGDLGRNTMTGPSFKNFDFSVTKDFEVGEDRVLEFRTEFFNLTNHPNFGLPAQNYGSADFGVISSTVGSERQIQFGLRYEF